LPAGFRLAFDPDVRRPTPKVLIGGSPIRVFRLTSAGAAVVDRWIRGEPVAQSPSARALAGRLVDAGLAQPRPGPGPHPGAGDCTIIIPVKDQDAGLTATLDRLGEVAAPVLIVDDGSRTPVVAPFAVVRHDSPRGPAAARNTGWRRATTEIVVFVDAGCRPHSEWLDRLLPHFADPAIGAVAPRIETLMGPGTPAWLGRYEKRRSPLDLGPRPGPVHPQSRVPYVPTATLAVRRAGLDAVGGFDETLRFGEDVDFVWRLHRAGWRVRYEPAARMRHPARGSLGAWIDQRFRYGNSAAPLAARHGRDVAPLWSSPWSVASWGLALAGHTGAGAALALGTSGALARRAPGDRRTEAALAGLALTGHLRTGSALARAVRKAWLPPAVVVAAASRGRSGRRIRRALALSLLGASTAEWLRTRPNLSLPTWVALSLADDLAYQAGVWSGVWRSRSAGALWPNW
jgi:mycofactocin system glycosyltransferase